MKFTLRIKSIGFRVGDFGFYLHPLMLKIRIYRKTSAGNLSVTDYWFNPLKNYRQRIEREVTERHLETLRRNHPEIFEESKWICPACKKKCESKDGLVYHLEIESPNC